MRRTLPFSVLLLLAPLHVTAASIRGRVVGGEEAVAGAKISAYAIETVGQTIVRTVANPPRVPLATTTSAADGTFALPIDGTGCVTIRVDSPSFAPSFTDEALGDSDVLISLAPKKPREITLRLPTGPVADARVVLNGTLEQGTGHRGRGADGVLANANGAAVRGA